MTNPKHTSSDLVKRLREVSSVLFDDYGDGTYAVEDYALATKAADRIEALEADNERLRGLLSEALDELHQWRQREYDPQDSWPIIDAIRAALEARHD